eukprot:TRINITY_DN24326_c0_g1_i1.p1 TRINITY_DN24326_c0_g1~~TRINITY_DN24326_c0_g1_i1.p1  ORF type:complete len:442 (-),score=60.17 TRINITY_DN24326_c0_g1_i1:51-1376(-)
MHSQWVMPALVTMTVFVATVLEGCTNNDDLTTTSPSPDSSTTSTTQPSPDSTNVLPIPETTASPTATTGTGGLSPPADSPVAQYGQISVAGTKFHDQHGKPVRLQGMSMFWSQWEPGAKYYNKEVIQWLVTDWKIQLVRAAMGIHERSGYLFDPETEKQKVETVVDAAISLGVYVIIDWHDHSAEKNVASAKAFFSEMAQKYGDKPNVLFEPYNEPISQSWAEIKSYHEEIVAEIRKYSQNLIILGTRRYSQEVDEASKDPVQGTNLAYTLHFYAASSSHQQRLRDLADAAMNNGAAIFITEWGTCSPDGDGEVDPGGTQAWMDYLEQHNLSSANWAISDKDEACAALLPGASAGGAWPSEKLSTSGALIRSILRGESTTQTTTTSQTTSWNGECPSDASGCGCSWTQNGAKCGTSSDDNSKCWCVCCCPSQNSCGWKAGR